MRCVIEVMRQCTARANRLSRRAATDRWLAADEGVDGAADAIEDSVRGVLAGAQQVAFDLEALPIQDLPLLVRHDEASEAGVDRLRASRRRRLAPRHRSTSVWRRRRSTSSISWASSATVRYASVFVRRSATAARARATDSLAPATATSEGWIVTSSDGAFSMTSRSGTRRRTLSPPTVARRRDGTSRTRGARVRWRLSPAESIACSSSAATCS